MAKWKTLARQADSLQTDAEEMYAQAEAAQCPVCVHVLIDNLRYRDTRCERDVDHPGPHHVN